MEFNKEAMPRHITKIIKSLPFVERAKRLNEFPCNFSCTSFGFSFSALIIFPIKNKCRDNKSRGSFVHY